MKHISPEIRVGLNIAGCLGFPAWLVPSSQSGGLLACGCKLPCTNVHVALWEMLWWVMVAAILIRVVETMMWREMWTCGMASRGPPF